MIVWVSHVKVGHRQTLIIKKTAPLERFFLCLLLCSVVEYIKPSSVQVIKSSKQVGINSFLIRAVCVNSF